MSGRNPAPRRSYAGRSAQERRAERRERLLAAGLELFGTRGYAATSIERLCATASVSTRNFYEEFSGREELLTALHRDINERARDALIEAYGDPSGAGLAALAERTVRAFVTVTASDPRWARIAFVEVIGVSADLERHRARWRAQWAEAILAITREAVTRGEAPDRDYGLTVIAIIGAVDDLVHHWSARGQDIPLDDIVTELTHLMLAAITTAR
ncbi:MULTISPECIES: TetR/AcrR family transcriptional regulator [Actinomadura]|uniref:TetR family transcriptional regulator n=1 Tax=Actinomadura litoris TaxID=2678616 RepID=A0A7K1L7R7_9ACTN|nr:MULTISPECIES: TetR/AcrR family transcriptional regulator [Actinomadura]MBT2210654.1 TetR/AcrR family transcriptional regulator [Actinomadura sp. NEAU-AAG7]MUN40353.1 TetR family transcriptional regulator [Actinomadura litoris]